MCHDRGATTDSPPLPRRCAPAAGDEPVDKATTTEIDMSKSKRMR
jgi:hypothetical protein